MIDETTEDDVIARCAMVAHEVNRAYCAAIGDTSQTAWDNAPLWQRKSALNGVVVVLAGESPEESHGSWMTQKFRDGWAYGEIKDADKKTHPCLVPYADLPFAQKMKDDLFGAAVRATHSALLGASSQ